MISRQHRQASAVAAERFLWRPTWVHLEQPTFGLWGLGRLRWGWVAMTDQQWLDIRRRNAIGAGVIAVGAAVTAIAMMISGCKC